MVFNAKLILGCCELLPGCCYVVAPSQRRLFERYDMLCLDYAIMIYTVVS